MVWLTAGAAYAAPDSITYDNMAVLGKNVDVVTIDLEDPYVMLTPVVAKDFPKAPEGFESMVSRESPAAAINGNFFCKNTYLPVGDVVVDGSLVHFGGLGTAMAITYDNEVEFITVERYRHMDWSKYKAVISCGPRLLSSGQVVVDPASEGFSDPNLFGDRNRSAVGITWDNKALFVTVNTAVDFRELADIMKDLGCVEAMNLDGGGSSGLYYRGEVLRSPKTPMPNILVVHEKKMLPSVMIGQDEGKGTRRIEILSALALDIGKDRFLVRGLKDGKVLLIMKFDDERCIEAPMLNAKFETSDRFKVRFPVFTVPDPGKDR